MLLRTTYGGNIFFVKQRLSRSTVPFMGSASFQSLNCTIQIYTEGLSQSMSLQTGIKSDSNQVQQDFSFLYCETIRIPTLVSDIKSKLCRGSAQRQLLYESLHFILASPQPTRTNGAICKLKGIFTPQVQFLDYPPLSHPLVFPCTSLSRQSLLACTLKNLMCVLHWPNEPLVRGFIFFPAAGRLVSILDWEPKEGGVRG